MSEEDMNQMDETLETTAPRELTEEERQQLAELDEALEKFIEGKRWSDAIKTILAKADLVVDPEEKVALLKEAGTLYVERSSNQAEAIKCFEAVLEISPHDLEAIERLKEMYEKRRAWEPLVRLMGREAELLDPADRAIRYVEMAELATQRLRKPEICIEMWELVLGAEPGHPQAIEALAPLYERAREWEKLTGVLETLSEAEPDPEQQKQQLQKLGMIYGDKLENHEGAVNAFERLLSIDPDDRRAQDQLKRRYVALKAWDKLEEFYEHVQNGMSSSGCSSAKRILKSLTSSSASTFSSAPPVFGKRKTRAPSAPRAPTRRSSSSMATISKRPRRSLRFTRADATPRSSRAFTKFGSSI